MAMVLNCTFCPTKVPPRIVAVLEAKVNYYYRDQKHVIK